MKLNPFSIITFTLLLTLSTCTPPNRVIEILSFDPQDTAENNDKITQNFEKVLEDSFLSAKTLVEADQLGFYSTLNEEEDFRFFSPNIFSSYAISYAHFQGLLAKKNNKQFSEVVNDIKNYDVRAVDQQNGIYSLASDKDNFVNTFRIIDSSVLLQAPSFECENRQKHIEANKKKLPNSVTEACGQAAKDLGLEGDVAIQDLLDLYRESVRNQNTNVPGLESCVEQYIFSVYFSNEVLVKLNAGQLLSEVSLLLSSKEKTPRFYSYNVENEMFLAVLTAIQKAVAASEKAKDGSLGSKLYWSSIRKFNKKVLFEVYQDPAGKEDAELKVIIQGQSNQVLLNMGIKLQTFLREVAPFMVKGFNDWESVCTKESEGSYDLRTTILPKGPFLDVINVKSQLMFYLIIVGAVIIVLAISYRCSGKGKGGKKEEVEFQKLGYGQVDLEEGESEDSESGVSRRQNKVEDNSDKFDIT